MITPIQTEIELRHGVECACRGQEWIDSLGNCRDPQDHHTERHATRHNPNGVTKDISLICTDYCPPTTSTTGPRDADRLLPPHNRWLRTDDSPKWSASLVHPTDRGYRAPANSKVLNVSTSGRHTIQSFGTRAKGLPRRPQPTCTRHRYRLLVQNVDRRPRTGQRTQLRTGPVPRRRPSATGRRGRKARPAVQCGRCRPQGRANTRMAREPSNSRLAATASVEGSRRRRTM